MKRILALLPLMVSLAVHASESPELDASGQVTAPVVETAPPDLDSLLKPQSKATTKVTDIRNQLLTDMGNTVGFRGGMAARARELVEGLNARSPSLDAMFKFAPSSPRTAHFPGDRRGPGRCCFLARPSADCKSGLQN